jgi:hypothetical protein
MKAINLFFSFFLFLRYRESGCVGDGAAVLLEQGAERASLLLQVDQVLQACDRVSGMLACLLSNNNIPDCSAVTAASAPACIISWFLRAVTSARCSGLPLSCCVKECCARKTRL